MLVYQCRIYDYCILRNIHSECALRDRTYKYIPRNLTTHRFWHVKCCPCLSNGFLTLPPQQNGDPIGLDSHSNHKIIQPVTLIKQKGILFASHFLASCHLVSCHWGMEKGRLQRFGPHSNSECSEAKISRNRGLIWMKMKWKQMISLRIHGTGISTYHLVDSHGSYGYEYYEWWISRFK